MNPLTIKFQLNEDIRRVKVDEQVSYSGLLQAMSSSFKEVPEECFQNASLKYEDDEKDWCTVTCTEELQEAFRAYSKPNSSSILKLVITLGAMPQKEEKVSQQDQQPTPKFKPFFERPEGAGCNGRWAGWRQAKREMLDTLQSEGLALMDAKDYQKAKETFEKQLSTIRCQWRRSTPLYNIACCESLLGNKDSALAFLSQAIMAGYKDLDHMMSDPDLENIRDLEGFKEIVSEINRSAYVCSLGPKPYKQLQQKSLALMRCGKKSDIETARVLLMEQLKNAPNDWQKRVPLYNLACCESILGNVDYAFEFLQKSIECGYHNVKKLISDPDLAILRDNELFQAIVASLKSGHHNGLSQTPRSEFKLHRKNKEFSLQQPQQETPQQETSITQQVPVQEMPIVADVQEPIKKEEPTVIAEEKPVFSPKEMTPEEKLAEDFKTSLDYLEQMGFVDRNENARVLFKASGVLAQAVKILLGD